ncbi:MAG: hypothetical protein ABIJ61_10405, partial [bacterium]
TMEHIVYILGSGFSQPLGLPVMSNFWEKARDLYYDNPDQFPHFKDIVDDNDRLGKVMTYYDTDLLNIEEILSILEMEDFLSKDTPLERFTDFIKDTIEASTPPAPKPSKWLGQGKMFEPLKGNFPGGLFVDLRWKGYVDFVFSLLRLQLGVVNVDTDIGQISELEASQERSSGRTYAVVTLNYDLVVETIMDIIRVYFRSRPGGDAVEDTLPLAKLHGSINGSLVPPTWRKWTSEPLRKAWRSAYAELSKATHIRILGYSLPISDTYIRYLFEASVLRSQRLKRIDIISSDPNGSLDKHYSKFVPFRGRRFKNANIAGYLNPAPSDVFWRVDTKETPHGKHITAVYDRLEDWHEKFMRVP